MCPDVWTQEQIDAYGEFAAHLCPIYGWSDAPSSRPPLVIAPSKGVGSLGPKAGRSTKMRSFLRRVLFGEDVIVLMLNQIDAKLNLLIGKEKEDMADFNQVTADLTQRVAAATSVMESAKTLISGMAANIRANSGDPAALEALANSLDAETTSLASAVTENTAAANLGTATAAPSDTVTPTPPSDTAPPATDPAPPVDGAPPATDTSGADATP